MNELINTTTFQEDIAIIKDSTTKVFLVSGKILQGIQDNKKYKEAGYKTFAEAVKIELGLDKPQAYRLMSAASAYENLVPIGTNLPTSESQLRAISKLPAPEQLEIWQEVAKDKVPTAKEVQEYVNKKYPKEKKVKVVKDIVVDNSTTIDTTKYITIEEHNKIILEYEKACTEDIDRLMKENSELKSKLQFFEKDFIEPAPKKSTLLPRQAMFDFIKKRGSEIQCHALKNDNLDNEKLFNLFVKVREDYKTSTPPPAWDIEIINTTGIL